VKKRIVVLGGGTGGALIANRLRRRYDVDEAVIHVVDRDNRHVYQPVLLFVPFGLTQVEEIVRPRRRQLRGGVLFHEAEIDSVSIERDRVSLRDGSVLRCDVLVIASGVRLQPEETEGMTGPGWNERVFTFYDAPGAAAVPCSRIHGPGGKWLYSSLSRSDGRREDGADRRKRVVALLGARMERL
jgi:sulfide:quinone oxidoreductase